MSDYHVLEAHEKDHQLRVVFHLPIPETGNNAVGVQWRAAVVEYQRGNTDSCVPNLAAEEQTQLTNGELYEHSVNLCFDAAMTNAQKVAIVEAAFTKAKNGEDGVLEILKRRLKYWGKTGNVA